MTAKTLVLLTSSKRSRTLTVLVCASLVLACVQRLYSPSALLFSRPLSPHPPPTDQNPLGADEYHGPRFDIYGLPDFADSIEVATLHIKLKEDPPKQKPGINRYPVTPPVGGSVGLAQPPAENGPGASLDVNRNARRDGSSSFASSLANLQHQLPIALPHFHSHRLDSVPFNISDLEHPPPGAPPASISLDLPAQPLSQPDASSLLFGVATTLDRMPETLRNFRHWAAHTGAHFVVVHEPYNATLRPSDPSPDDVLAMYRDAGIAHITLVEQSAGWAERFVSLLGATHRAMSSKTKWAVLIDDDTFFFDLAVVMARLKKYDHRREWYVGALSENKWNLNHDGLFAVGGAGVFLSKGLLDAMAPHAGACYPPSPTEKGGDRLVSECINRWTTTKLTIEHGLYQLDLHGDTSGFYEAVREQPVSVHHWKSWHHVDMPAVATVATKCGRGCVLQHFAFQDGWQMSNGFSIFKYKYNETSLASQHPLAMEHTWKATIWDIEDSWDHSLAPLKDRDEGKVQLLLERSEVDEDGTVTQFYVRRENGVGKALIRVVWR